MNTAPIGVFDSGIGGLTAVKELRALLPGEDIVYFGDTARLPYGSRGFDTIVSYARQDIAFLLSKGVKTVVAACGTVSTTLPAEVAASLPIPYTGVVEAAAATAAAVTNNKRVGLVATEASIATGRYVAALAALDPGIQCVQNPCPLFVPLVEAGHFCPGDPMARLAIEEYLTPVREAGVDTLILGCTHYPLLAGAIGAFMGPGVTLVDTGRETAQALRRRLEQDGLLNPRPEGGKTRFYATDDIARFSKLAGIFLGGAAEGPVERVYNIEAYRLT